MEGEIVFEASLRKKYAFIFWLSWAIILPCGCGAQNRVCSDLEPNLARLSV